MIDRTPRELFAQQPIRSDYSTRRIGRRPLRLRRWIALALLLGIVGGLAANWYSAQQEQSPTEIPTIKAENPVKQRPEQPGGIDIPHQNETVFQKIDNSTARNKQSGVEHLLPPPTAPKPVDAVPQGPSASASPSTTTSSSSVTSTTIAPTPSAAPIAPVVATTSAYQSTAEPTKKEVFTPPLPSVTATAVDKAQSLASTVTATASLAETKEQPLTTEEKPVTAAKTIAATKTETKPAEESKPAAKSDKTPSKTASSMSIPKEMFTDSEPKVAAKGFRVQLGSFPEQTTAQAEMKKLQSKYADTLGGVKLRLTQAELGGKGTYYRVQGGPMSDAQARSICAKLWSQKAPCIVVRP